MAEVPLPTPTQVPVPSTDIRNAVFAGAKLDEEVTGTGEFYTDRLGVKRLTNTGRNNQFDAAQLDRANRFEQFLLSSGYVFLGDYEDGPFQFSARNQYIRYNNQYYRLNVTTDVGFTTTGTDATSFANDVMHFVLMDGDTLRQNLGSGEGTKLIVAPGNGNTLYDWINGQLRSLFYYLSPAKIASVIGGTATDITAELQAAMNDSITIWIPAGKYYITSSITVAANSGLVGPGARMVSIDNQGSSHTFIFGAGGYIRGWKPWKGFKVTATGNNTADAWTFYYSSREDGSGNPDYTVAQHFSEIEIESYGKIGGGWYLQECFRVVVRDCGATGLSWCFRLAGSVVQTTIDNFVHNGDSSVVMSGQTYTFGLTTELKAYSSGSSFSPEGLTVSNTRFVRQGVGCRITGGLLLTFDAVEFDYSGRYGALYNGGSQVSFNDCYVGVQANRPNDFVGFLVPATATNVSEAVNIRGCTVNMATNTNADAASYTQYGVQIGNSATPAKSTLVDGCTFRGNGYTAGIYVYAGSNTHLSSNRFQYTGVNILVDSASSFTMMNNSGNGSGTYSLTSSSATAKWFIINNTETFSTFSHPNPQYVFAFNTNYTTSNIRRINRASSAVNTSIAAGAVYNHTISVNTSLVASVPVGGVIPNGLIFSAKPATTTSVVITFYNPTSAAITLNTTLYVDVIYEPI